MPKTEILTWHELTSLTVKLARREKQEAGVPDVVVGIARGGLPLVTIIASYFNIRNVGVAFASSTLSDEAFAERRDETIFSGLSVNTLIDNRNILLVDDIIRSGNTIRSVLPSLMNASSIRVLTLFGEVHSLPLSVSIGRPIAPDTWIQFPWDATTTDHDD